MTTKHTPGPWYEHSHRQIGPAAGIVCEVWSAIGWGNVAINEADANVRLIAAAPDLLEALILLEAEMVASGNAQATDFGWKPAIEKTRAAIAKATGAQP